MAESSKRVHSLDLIEDEHGTPWTVDAGDPGRKAVLALHALGVRYVVLPRAYLTGRVSYDIMLAEGALAVGVPEFLPPPGAEPRRILRRARLLTCIEALRRPGDLGVVRGS